MFTENSHKTHETTEVIPEPDVIKEMNENNIDDMLERERQFNKRDTWVKLGKPAKIQRLHAYAETYGKEHALPTKDIKQLKLFFISCLDKNKLDKTKDVVYNKDEMKIISIPALHYNKTTHNYTLKILDNKRVSTLKSLTPKRTKVTSDLKSDNV